MRRKKQPTPEQLRFQQIYDEYVAPNLPPEKPLASPCLKGRRRHYFREPKTRSLTPDLTCKWCDKTVAQVRAEQKKRRRQDETGPLSTVDNSKTVDNPMLP